MFSLSGLTAALPVGMSAAWCALVSITSSLTCMAVWFELNEEGRGALESALRDT